MNGWIILPEIFRKTSTDKWVNLSHILQGVVDNFKNYFQKSEKFFISFLKSTHRERSFGV